VFCEMSDFGVHRRRARGAFEKSLVGMVRWLII
jgi:hypothetical protein